MGTRVAARQVVRWTVRSASSVVAPPQFSRCHLQCAPVLKRCRLLSSSTSQRGLQSNQHNHELIPLSSKPATELSLRSLVDMGFTDTQAERICNAVSKVRGESSAKHALSTLTVLFVLGLSPSSVLKLLEKCPDVLTVKESHLQQRIDNLRKLGSLQRVVTHHPQILTLTVKTVNRAALFLREKCLFTVQQVTDILRDSPAIVGENMAQLEYKFQYVYFRMGVKQAEMVKCRLFRFTLDEVRVRHCFLERRGLYQTPDKHGQTLIINPKLDIILNVNQDIFLTQVAKASAEEYDVFKRLMARELQEQEWREGSAEADSDAEEEEEDEEDEETGGKSGYRKRRNK
uniref:transcription termination factor 4, mitochondrial isoform X1 n=1 Tax=Scatophagus argus TaxID=75038 RepID=UPI001ED7ED82|nr:transcription termination factor 4, mitochondrial isoform X1 [Scatophagus argus]